MRVLLNTFHPASTVSYGVICYELWRRLQRTGYFEIKQLAWGPRGWDKPLWECIPAIPREGEVDGYGAFPNQWGQEDLDQAIHSFAPDVLWSMGDPYMIETAQGVANAHGVKHVAWSLLCSPPTKASHLRTLSEIQHLVAMTEWAAKSWSVKMDRSVPHIYLGVDLSVFKPHENPKAIRKEALSGTVGESDFLILFVGKNQDRKRVFSLFQLLKSLRVGKYLPSPFEEFPKEIAPHIKLCMHTNPKVHERNQYDLSALAGAWGLPKEAVILSSSKLVTEELVKLYQSSDLLVMPSGAEGFGMPLIEASACGLPSVVNDFSACSEVGRMAGSRMVTPLNYSPTPETDSVWIANPDVREMMEHVLSYADHIAKYGWHPSEQQALTKRVSPLSWEIIATEWLAFLQDVGNQETVQTFGAKL